MRSGSTACRARQISLPALKPWYKKFKKYYGNLSAGHFYHILSVIGWSVCRGIPEGLAIAHTHPFTRLTPINCMTNCATNWGSVMGVNLGLLLTAYGTAKVKRPFKPCGF